MIWIGSMTIIISHVIKLRSFWRRICIFRDQTKEFAWERYGGKHYDSIEYKNKQNKSKGYSLKDGKKSIKTKELKVNDGNRWNHVYVEGISKKKVTI